MKRDNDVNGGTRGGEGGERGGRGKEEKGCVVMWKGRERKGREECGRGDTNEWIRGEGR